MTLSARVRQRVDRRLAAIEAALAGIDGVSVERRGDSIRLRGRRLLARSIADVRVRFAGLMR